jgi:hypothetical protein
MYNSSSFKCQLSFNWHLNLNKVCATQSWCQHQDNGFEVTMVTVTLRSQTSHLHGDTWSDLVWYYIMKKILKRNMKNNHQNRCKNKNSTFKNRKHILHLGASFLFVDFRSEKCRLCRGSSNEHSYPLAQWS